MEEEYLSHRGEELTKFKQSLDMSGHKDNEWFIFNVMSDEERDRVLEHIYQEGCVIRKLRHLITDIDDTLFSSLMGGSDRSYTLDKIYPGAKKFHQLFSDCPYSTLLTARPQEAEESTRRRFQRLYETGEFVPVNVLSGVATDVVRMGIFGDLISSLLSTNNHLPLPNRLKKLKKSRWYAAYHSAAKRKVNHFRRYKTIYPEYEFTFLGDSGQGDIITGIDLVREGVRVCIREVMREPSKTNLPPSLREDLENEGFIFFSTYPELAAKLGSFLDIEDELAININHFIFPRFYREHSRYVVSA